MKAIVTGHTKGLGAALANNLLARGVPVLGLARTHAPETAAAYPDLFEEVELDLADAPALSAWLAGRGLADYIDGSGAVLLLNNAGMVSPVGPLDLKETGALADADECAEQLVNYLLGSGYGDEVVAGLRTLYR